MLTAQEESGPTRQSAPGILAKIVPYKARRPEAIHTISLADSSQLLVEREERSALRRVIMK